ncbi:MAG: hypothetical protein WC242_04100 [Candidatus Paceibacterota bacterium]|jgi:type II secretory pathway pseudopilin PulG
MRKISIKNIILTVVVCLLFFVVIIIMASRPGSRSRARDSRRVSDVRQIELALELYYAAHLQYPEVSTSGLATLATEGFLNMSGFPTDPTTRNPYCYAVGKDLALDQGQYYHVGARLENKDSDMLTQDADNNTQNSANIIWNWNQSPDCGTNPANSNFNGTDSKKSPIYDRGVFPK